MLTGRAALARPDINTLGPTVIVEVPHPGASRADLRRHGMRSTFDQQLRRSGRVLNVERTLRRAAQPRKDGPIPTTGKARRNAKRNRHAPQAAEQ
jgi:hypothetical protein